jgi:Cys-tRNA(Pro) deacylase
MAVDFPVTPAVRFLRERNFEFVPHLYDYVEKGGTRESSKQLGLEEHSVIKTLVFETSDRKPIVVLMHGDREVSAKNMARVLGVKSVEPATPEKVTKLTGYSVGGTSPFGTRTQIPVYAERTIFELDRIYINGGKRGFLIEIEPAVLRAIDAVEVEVGIGN